MAQSTEGQHLTWMSHLITFTVFYFVYWSPLALTTLFRIPVPMIFMQWKRNWRSDIPDVKSQATASCLWEGPHQQTTELLCDTIQYLTISHSHFSVTNRSPTVQCCTVCYSSFKHQKILDIKHDTYGASTIEYMSSYGFVAVLFNFFLHWSAL